MQLAVLNIWTFITTFPSLLNTENIQKMIHSQHTLLVETISGHGYDTEYNKILNSHLIILNLHFITLFCRQQSA